MNQVQPPDQFIKQIQCPKHHFQSLDQIDLTGRSPYGRMCLLCIKQKNVPYEQYLSVSELFEQKQNELLNYYPPFKSQNTRNKIQNYCEEKVQKANIDLFFSQFREDIEVVIKEAENKAKQSFIKNENQKQVLLQELAKIGETEKLKELLVSGSDKINVFLQEKWKNADKNEQIIKRVFDQIKFNPETLNLSEKQIEVNGFLETLSKFSLLEPVIKKMNLNLIKSTTSSSLDTYKTKSNSLKFINNSQYAYSNASGLLDFVLDPKKRYTIRLNYQPKSHDYSYFQFGIVSNEITDSNWCMKNKMSYCNQNENHGISKYVKGLNITNHQRKNQKEYFEIIIFLNQQILKVSSLPNYESIIELDDMNKIKLESQYRFFIYIQQVGDMIEITDIMESQYQFENEQFL